MKKILTLTSFFLLLLFCSSTCQGNFGVQPRELSITMNDEFIQGNTLKSIKITNPNDYDINISWYLDHPSSDLIRPNKTLIPDFSWIDLKPQWQIISANSNAIFYIFLNIPENEENLNHNWETWVTFKQEKKQFINIENAVRLYIDTPSEMTTSNNQDSDSLSIRIGDQIKIPLFDIVIVAVIILLLVIGILFIKKKKSKI
jgi:hypothetical protein